MTDEIIFKISSRINGVIAPNKLDKKFWSLSFELNLIKIDGCKKILYLNMRTLGDMFARGTETLALARRMNTLWSNGAKDANCIVN